MPPGVTPDVVLGMQLTTRTARVQIGSVLADRTDIPELFR